MGLALSLIDEDASAAGFAGATTAATMMAIVHRRYGRPDVLEYTEVDKPVVGDGDVLVARARGRCPPRRLLRHDRCAERRAPGVRAAPATPRHPRHGPRRRGGGGRQERHGLQPGDEVFGWSTTGTLAEYACVPADQLVPQARQPGDGAGGGGAHVGHHRTAGAARHRARATGADGAGHGRIGRRRARSPCRSPRRSAQR